MNVNRLAVASGPPSPDCGKPSAIPGIRSRKAARRPGHGLMARCCSLARQLLIDDSSGLVEYDRLVV